MTAPLCVGFNRINYPALPNFAIQLSLIHVITYTMSLSYVACHALFYSFNKDGKLGKKWKRSASNVLFVVAILKGGWFM